MDETNWSSDFYADIFFFRLWQLVKYKKKKSSLRGRASTFQSKVVTDHVFALEYFSYINKYSTTEILAICH